MPNVSVIEFAKSVPPYHVGDRASFQPETARAYVHAGAASMVRENVPLVDPKTIEERKHALAAERAQGIEAILAEALAGRGQSARNRAA